ncbi:Hydrogenase/urease nickel incorporation protein HypA [Gimesia alba]|uniref:Hydrogenase maturation factor HypA n=1 Tax=Gimesia alba TaxID=2527973 RepID=A0A517RIX7_9PLAN|nr:hydrogenase maturation nickel metallochaperone HypA [Gimesia alba]QDT43829.1 Hydrogenase/urease nickel incorporation protein HypA [Gimesia alba]
MHERSLVQRLLHQVQQIVAEDGGGRVTEIRVQVGDLSGVEPLLFQAAFEEMVSDLFSSECQLALDIVPVMAVCDDCGQQFEIVDFQFQCPACPTGAVQVIQGDEVKLISINVSSDNPVEGVAS